MFLCYTYLSSCSIYLQHLKRSHGLSAAILDDSVIVCPYPQRTHILRLLGPKTLLYYVDAKGWVFHIGRLGFAKAEENECDRCACWHNALYFYRIFRQLFAVCVQPAPFEAGTLGHCAKIPRRCHHGRHKDPWACCGVSTASAWLAHR